MHLLLFKLAGMGDLLLASPAVRACRRSWPEARITLLTGQSNRTVYAHCPHLDGIETIDDRRLLAGSALACAREAWALRRRLRALRPDVALVLHKDWRHNLLFRLAGVPRRYGFARDGGGRFLTRAVATTREQHDIEKYLAVCALVDGFRPDGEHVELFPGAADREAVDALLTDWRCAARWAPVALAPGGAANAKEEMATRRWPLEHYVELAGRLLADDRHVLLVGGPGDRRFTERILEAHPAAAGGRIRDATGRLSPHGSMLLLRHAALLVTHDCGPMHLGAVAGIPVLALYGPTVPAETRPRTAGSRVLWRREQCACIPCYHEGRFPACAHGRCLAEITPAEVLTACRDMLAALPQKA